MVFRTWDLNFGTWMWDFNFGTWISHRGFTVAFGRGHPLVLYIIAKMVSVRPSVCPCGQKLGSAWKILPITARSLWGQFVITNCVCVRPSDDGSTF
jgi:hypothetical protein